MLVGHSDRRRFQDGISRYKRLCVCVKMRESEKKTRVPPISSTLATWHFVFSGSQDQSAVLHPPHSLTYFSLNFFSSLSFSPLFPVRSPKRGGAGCGWYYTRALKVREMRTWLISTVPKSPPPPLPPPSFPNPVHLCKGEKNDWFSFFFFTLVYTSLHFYDYTKHHPLGPLPSLG